MTPGTIGKAINSRNERWDEPLAVRTCSKDFEQVLNKPRCLVPLFDSTLSMTNIKEFLEPVQSLLNMVKLCG
jgi:hypothetical protein